MDNETKVKIIARIINEVDPFGLIDPDTPESWTEYVPEAKKVVELMNKKLNIDELRKKIIEIFVAQFGDNSELKLSEYRKVADLLRDKGIL